MTIAVSAVTNITLPAVGQTATASNSGAASYTIGFTATSVAGTYLVAAISSGGAGVTATIDDNGGSGGTWNAIATGSTIKSFYYKLCNATEPAAYKVTYSGTLAPDNSVCALIEVTGANSANPDDNQIASNSTGTPPTATSADVNDLAIVAADSSQTSGGGFFNTAPSGYTLNARSTISGGAIILESVAAIASLQYCGSGTITPGNWGTPGAGTSKLLTILFKP